MKILIHCAEAGISTYLEPVAKELQKREHRVKLDLHSKASDFFQSFKEDSFESPDLLICGYDNIEIDKTTEFLKRYDGIPSLGFLDTWKGIDRFWDQSNRQRLLTHILFVPDSICFNYLQMKKLKTNRLHIAGHPLRESFKNISSNRIEVLKNYKSQIDESLPNLVFFSEPIFKSIESKESLTQQMTLSGSSLLEELTSKYEGKYNLFLKCHPLENIKTPNLWISLDSLEIKDALSISDYSLGLSSTVLAYSKWANVRTHSISELLKDWKPEYSNLPSPLWDLLKDEGAFEYPSSNNSNDDNSPRQFSFDTIQKVFQAL